MASSHEATDHPTPQRHVLALSGGKDSTALAIYLKDLVPNMEYVFCDTGEELPETYDYLLKIEAILGSSIVRLNPDRPFNHHLDVFRGVLPDPRTRWCTKMLKIRPFEQYVGDAPTVLYVGIRADESHRKGYISRKPNVQARFPFVEDGIRRTDVIRILEDSGIGLPSYYEWRSRSGCYFCFFQQLREWVGLLERHPDLFRKAMAYEREDAETGERYTWVANESLAELSRPERVAQVKAEYARRLAQQPALRAGASLGEVLDTMDVGADKACLICHL